MKRITILFVMIGMLFFAVQAQTPCPEFSNSVSALDKEGISLIELELAKATLKQKKKGLYGGWNNSVRLNIASSSVKIKGTTTFVFKPYDTNMRPEGQIRLYSFDSSKDFRELTTGGTNVFGGSKNKKSEDTSIPLKLEKLEDGCYKITIIGKISVGEYAFSLGVNAGVQGQSTGFGSDSGGQAWYAFKAY